MSFWAMLWMISTIWSCLFFGIVLGTNSTTTLAPTTTPTPTPTAPPNASVTTCWESMCNNQFQLGGKNGGPMQVKIGAFITQISQVDTINIQVKFDFYYWLKWDFCQRDEKNNTINPHQTIEYTNTLACDLFKTQTYMYPQCNIFTGEAYWEVRLQGTYNQFYNFVQYPLDNHYLEFQFEDGLYSRQQQIYIKDSIISSKHPSWTTSGIKDGITISGWFFNGSLLETEQPSYYFTSDFDTAYGTSEYSNYRFGIVIERGAIIFIFKVLPPILFAVGFAFLCLLLDVESMDSRIQVISGIILGIIFLQLFFESGVTTGGYLTLVDWVFNLTYLMSVSILVECIIVRQWHYHKTNVVESYEEEIRILKYSKDEVAPTSKHLKQKQKEGKEIKPNNKFVSEIAWRRS